MDPETKQVCQDLVNEIGRAKTFTSDLDIHELFVSSETIIGLLAYLIKPKADLEQVYRIAALPKRDSSDKEESQSRAEARAKSTDGYREWRKLCDLYDLGHEQVMLLKKFKEDIAMEKQRI